MSRGFQTLRIIHSQQYHPGNYILNLHPKRLAMSSSLDSQSVLETMKAKPVVTQTNSGVNIPYPFPSPADWRDHWIYFLLVDRFNNPAGPPVPDLYPCLPYQGGNFSGIR